MQWKFTLPNSKELRQAVEDENGEVVLNEIVKGYEHLSKRFGDDEYFNECIQSVKDDIECGAFDEDSANYHLTQFYDECDDRKVWIEL